MLGPDIEKLLPFLSLSILVFINQGTSSLSDAFSNDPWSWGLSVPMSLYLKFALELHAHLGLCVGVGLPSLLYWGATRRSIDWYWDIVLEFNSEFMKTGLFNLVIGLAHWLLSKLIHRFLRWVKDHKVSANWSVTSKLESLTYFSENPLFPSPFAAKDMFLKMLELLSVFFYNGNVMLLSWSFAGQKYTSEIGKGITWVSLGSTMFVWLKALLKLLEVPQAIPEEKAYKLEKDQSSIQSLGSKEQPTCSSEC